MPKRRVSRKQTRQMNPSELVSGIAYDFLDEWAMHRYPIYSNSDEEYRETAEERREEACERVYPAIFDCLSGMIISGKVIDRMAMRTRDGGGTGIDRDLYHRLSQVADSAYHGRLP
jgi:hypothetical protein